eukprot:Gb_15913 [translate_table: standard]
MKKIEVDQKGGGSSSNSEEEFPYLAGFDQKSRHHVYSPYPYCRIEQLQYECPKECEYRSFLAFAISTIRYLYVVLPS